MNISPTAEIIDEIRLGRMVVLVDAEDRENEGDIVLAADFVTPEAINFMATHARGLICLTLTEERCRQLALPLMVSDNRSPHGTAFTVSIEAATGVSTGISAADRARTVRMAVAKHAKPADIVQPGHIFPVMAQNGGVLVRAGHTEAGCDLAELAGLTPAAVICEIMKPDGEMARLPDLVEFADRHGLKLGTIADLIRHRSENEKLIERVADRPIATPYGPFRLCVYHDSAADELHYALVQGRALAGPPRPGAGARALPFDRRVRLRREPPRLLGAGRDAHHRAPQGGRDRAAAPPRGGRTRSSSASRRSGARARRAQVGPEAARHRRADPARPRRRAACASSRGPKRIPSMAGFGLEVVEYVSPDDADAGEGRMTAFAPDLKGDGLAVAIVWSRFNEDIVRELLTACDRELVNLGVAPADIDVVSVPGRARDAARPAGAGAAHARLRPPLRRAGGAGRGDPRRDLPFRGGLERERARHPRRAAGDGRAGGQRRAHDEHGGAGARARAVKGAEAARVAVEMANLLKAVSG